MVTRADMEMTEEKTIFLYWQFPRNSRHGRLLRATQESPGFVTRWREQGENVGKKLYYGFCGKESERQNKQALAWLVGIISVDSGLPWNDESK